MTLCTYILEEYSDLNPTLYDTEENLFKEDTNNCIHLTVQMDSLSTSSKGREPKMCL